MRAIAVLPFDNLSGDPEQEYFADGIAEDLITRLSQQTFLAVIARNSTFTYKGESVDVKRVGEELGARYVVEGSVRRAGDRVRISAQLIDAATGHHVWAERYDRELEDVFAVQDEIVLAIASEIGAATFRSESERTVRRDPQSLDAWECALRASWHFWKFTRDDNAAARSLWERANELDPHWVWPYQAVTVTHLLDLGRPWTSDPDASRAALLRAADRAMALDDRDAWAQLAQGIAHMVTGRVEEKIAAFQRAARLDPNNTTAHLFLGIGLTQANRPDEALASLGQAATLSPRDLQMPIVRSYEGLAHLAAGRYDAAIAALRQSIDLDPQDPLPRQVLAASLAEVGRVDEARRALSSFEQLQPGFSLADAGRSVASVWDPALAKRFLDGLRKAGLPEE